MKTKFHPDWLKAPYPDSILMPKYRVTVREINEPTTATEMPREGDCREVFAQTFDGPDFDLTSIVLALNKRRRVRKARAGKEEK